MKYQLHKNFVKSYRKFPKKLQLAVKDKLSLFRRQPFVQELNNHALSGKYEGYRSINITGDYRAIYKIISEKRVIFVVLGTHAKLYG
jgi:addiction module RelE/StbE family toxin